MSAVWSAIVRSVEEYWHTSLSGALTALVVHGVAVLAIALLTLFLARFTSRAVQRGALQASADEGLALLLGRLAHLGVSGLGAGWILSVVGVPLAALAGFFGFFGLGLSMSLADVLKSLIAGAYLLIERPFWLGDTVSVKGFEGAVEAVRLRTTRLRTADGQIAIVPNSIMLTEAIACRPAAAAPTT